MQNTIPGRQLLRLPVVKLKTGLSRSTIYRLEAIGQFPRRIRLGANSTAWDSAAIDQWIAERAVATEAERGGRAA